MNHDNIERAKRDAQEAKALIESAAYKRAVERIREAQFKLIEQSAPEETILRETAFHMLRALRELQRALDNMIVHPSFVTTRNK